MGISQHQNISYGSLSRFVGLRQCLDTACDAKMQHLVSTAGCATKASFMSWCYGPCQQQKTGIGQKDRGS